MGKTALVRRFLESARGPGAVMLAGRCYERESVPYKALDSLVDALSQYLKRLPAAEAEALLPRDVLALARLFPGAPARRGGRGSAGAACSRSRIRRSCGGAPSPRCGSCWRAWPSSTLVLFIDDLQWGDVDSAALLAELLRPPRPPALLLIASYRTEDAARARSCRASSRRPRPGAAPRRSICPSGS